MTKFNLAYSTKSLMARQVSRFLPQTSFIGVLGDVGKTTTVLACQKVLSEKFETLVGTSSDLTTTLLKIRPKTKKVVVELNPETVEMAEHFLKLIRPQILIVVNLDYFDQSDPLTQQNIVEPKLKIINSLNNSAGLILNWEDPLIQQFGNNSKAQVFYFGKTASKCHIWADKIRFDNYQTVFELNYGVERVEIKTPLLGFHQVSCLLAAATLGSYLDIPLTSIKKGLEKMTVLNHHMEALQGFNGSVVIDDTYNVSVSAFEAALETLSGLAAKRRILVMTEMKGVKGLSEKYYRHIAQKIYNNKLDMVITGPGEASIIAEELTNLGFGKERILDNMSNPQIVNYLLKVVNKGDLILFKGSKVLKIDEVIKRVIIKND